jgi:formylglycine-generating enzyme required for sulfatase activity
MGSNSGTDDEQPVHTVFLDDFYIDLYEVTNVRFAECVDAGVCDTPADTTSFDSSYSRSHYYRNPEYDDYPVIYVSWYDAQDYCRWRGARLPTEAEWEKAARGGLEGKTYPWGNEPPVREFGTANGASFNDPSNVTDTDRVGSYGANGYGLYDMAGNLWEWVIDWYDENYYANSTDNNPSGPYEGGYPVIRGGSWSDSEIRLRVSDRRFNDPRSGALNIGFRCARDVTP